MPTQPSTPVRSTSERDLNQFNLWMHQQPWYQSLLQQWGLSGREGAIRLSRSQQSDVERAMQRNGVVLPSSMHIDQGGNLNQKNRTGRNAAIAGAIIGGAVAAPAVIGAMGASGAGAGAAGTAGAGGAAGAAGAALPSSLIGGSIGATMAPYAGAGLAGSTGALGAGAAGAGVASASGFGSPALTGLGMGGAPISTAAPTMGGAGAAGTSTMGRVGNIGRALGNVFGEAGRGAALERGGENQFIQGENNRAAQLYQTQQQALLNLLGQQERGTLDRAQLGITAPAARARQAALGSLMSRLMPSTLSGLPAGVRVPQQSGGIAGWLRSNPQGLRQGGRALEQQALQALLTGSDVPAMTDFMGQGRLAPPTAQPYRRAGRGESIMSGVGTAGSAVGAVLPYLFRGAR